MDKSYRGLTNDELLAELDRQRSQERGALPGLLACLSEVQRRDLHKDAGYRNLFDFCVGRLGYTEDGAYKRIRSAAAASRFPSLYVFLRDGQLSLTAVARLEPHLTRANFDSVIARAVGKRVSAIEELIAELFLQAPAEQPILTERKAEPIEQSLPFGDAAAPVAEVRTSHGSTAPNPYRRRDVVRREAKGVVRFSFQAGAGLREKLDRVRELLRRTSPSGRLEEILERLANEFLERHDPARKAIPAAIRAPRARQTRRIPQWVKDRVWARDEGRCVFTAPDGHRCEARSDLEFDHVVPWARRGSSDDPGNVRLLCRAHNLHLARKEFGALVPRGASA